MPADQSMSALRHRPSPRDVSQSLTFARIFGGQPELGQLFVVFAATSRCKPHGQAFQMVLPGPRGLYLPRSCRVQMPQFARFISFFNSGEAPVRVARAGTEPPSREPNRHC